MKLLFICTHNRCRSILAEAITRAEGGEMIEAASAGSEPAGAVHPLTLHYLQAAGIATAGLNSKSWDDLQGFEPDYVVTVCDRAAGESCPLWLGEVPKVHWGLADPSANPDSTLVDAAFNNTIATLRLRIQTLRRALSGEADAARIAEILADLANSCAEPAGT